MVSELLFYLPIGDKIILNRFEYFEWIPILRGNYPVVRAKRPFPFKYDKTRTTPNETSKK